MIKTLLFCASGAVFALLLNYIIIWDIVIPDPCYYHSHEASVLIKLFYSFEASEGFHPFPSTFNFFFTVFVGTAIGFFADKKVFTRRTKPKG